MTKLRLNTFFRVALFLVGLSLLPCPARSAVSYKKEVLEIFRAECLGCHNEDDKQGELDLSSYAAVTKGGVSGSVIEPGDPDESLLYRLVAHLDQPSMPPETPKIARESIKLIKQWIAEGAIEHASDAPDEHVSIGKLPAIVIPKSRKHRDPIYPPRLPQSSHQVTARNPAILALAASPVSPLIAVGGVRQVWFIRVDTNERLGRIRFSGGDIQCVQFSRDGSLLVIGGGHAGASGSVEIWDVAAGKKLFSNSSYLDSVTCVAISEDHQRLAVASTGPKIDLIDLQSGEVKKRLEIHTDWITKLAFSDDGVLLASADRAGGLHLWESWTGDLYHTLGGHKQSIRDLDWTYDSNFIASSGKDGFIRIWSVEDGSETQKIKAHAGGVIAHARRADGGWISAGRDQVLQVWSPEGKSIRAANPFSDTPTSLAYAPVGKRIVTGDYQGRLSGLDEVALEAVTLPSINPPSLDVQIKTARDTLKTRQQDYTELATNLQQLRRRQHYFSVALENESRLLAFWRAKADAKAEAILMCRRQLRKVKATLVATKDSHRQSQLLVERKLVANKLKQLIGQSLAIASDVTSQNARVQTREAELAEQIDRSSRANSELTAVRQDVKESVMMLAKLIEEHAYSTRNDLAMADDQSKDRVALPPLLKQAASVESTDATP